MKRRVPIILFILLFVVGIGFLSYPLVSSVVNNIGARNEASVKMSEAENIGTEKTDQFFDEAEEYNSSLTDTVILTDPFDKDSYEEIGAHYEETFNIDGNGLIGYIEIPKINVFLPIYHGTSAEVLKKGAGHVNNTSLPIGGEGTHSVISAHSAFPARTFFDYLTDMEEGDEFYIHVLNRTLRYEVNQIKTVLPENVNDLYVVDGEDYVTLLTCTPYTVNTHRLLVRGKRADNSGGASIHDGSVTAISAGNGSYYFLGYKITYLTAALIMGGFVLAVALIVVVIIRRIKKKSKKAVSGND